MHNSVQAMYVRTRPGSRITLKMETSWPMKPDWKTFQPEATRGLFMEMVVRRSAWSWME